MNPRKRKVAPVGAESLRKKTKSQEVNMHSVGTVAKDESPYLEREEPLEEINFDLTSASGSTKTFIIGDPEGLVADVHGISGNDADSGTITPSVFNKVMATNPISVVGISYKVTNSTSQFQKPFRYLSADVDDWNKKKNINWSAAERNNQFRDKLLTKRFKEAFPLDVKHALAIDVASDEDVYLTLFIQSYVS